jgi:putative methionine-R-sulfoxide reductase with GAF domain
MLYMIIETFRHGDAVPVYRRFRDEGRLAPDGLRYVASWVTKDLRRCFQIMECDDPSLLSKWLSRWEDLVEFEVIPVQTSAEGAALVASWLDGPVGSMTGQADDILDRLKALASRPMPRRDKAREAAGAIQTARGYRWVGLYDVTPEEIVAIAWTGSNRPAYPRFPVTQGLSGAAVATRRPVIVQDVSTDPRYLTAFGSTRAEAIFPVAIDDQILGTIDVESDRVNAFGSDDESFLRNCALVLAHLWV